MGTAVYQSILKRSPQTLGYILNELNGDVNCQIFGNLWTPLMFACVNGNQEAFDVLLNNAGLNIMSKNKDGETAVHYAIKHSRTEMALTLIKHQDFDPNFQNSAGRTVLMEAVTKENLDVVKALVEHADIDVTLKSELQDTALTCSSKVRNQKIKVLIEDASLEYLNTTIGRAFRNDVKLRVFCERMFNLKVREIVDIAGNRVDLQWLSWKVPIKNEKDCVRALEILKSLESEKNVNLVAIAEAIQTGNETVPIAKVV